MKWLRCGLLLLALCVFAPGKALAGNGAELSGDLAAGDTDRVLASAFLLDPSGELQVQDLAAQAFQPYRGILTLGNRSIVTWLRLTVRPSDRGDWVLLIQPTVVQNARVYEPRPDGTWRVQQLGNRFAHRERLNQALDFVAPVSLAGTAPLTFYVRVDTPSTLIQARVVSAEEAVQLDLRTHGALGVYSGITLTGLLLSLVGWCLTRERLWLASILVDAVNLVAPLAQLGFLAKYLLPDAVDVVDQVVIVTGIAQMASVTLFYWYAMVLFGATRWTYLPHAVTVCASPLLLLLAVAGRHDLVMAANHLTVLALTLWSVVGVWSARPPDSVLRWMWRVLTSLLNAYTLFWASALVLHARPTQLSLYPVLPVNLFTLGMTLSIAGRYTLARSRQLLIAEQQLLQEQARHLETSGFLGMLVHEVRNPLARIQAMTRRIANGQAPLAASQTAALTTIDGCAGDINAVLERSVDIDQLERGVLQGRPQAEDAAQRLRDWLARHRERERIEAEVPDALVATVDAGLWLSMVRNLVENALKYGPPGGRVRLSLQEAGDRFLVEVANAEGAVGRPDPALLFGKYYRSVRTEGISGTGLGLYWVFHLSKRLGGSLAYVPPVPPLPSGDRAGSTAAVCPAGGPTAGDGAVVFRLGLPLDGGSSAPR